MSNEIDLSNKVFGVLKVLQKDIQISKEKGRIYWLCECQKCKNIISVRTDNIKRSPKSCKLCRYPNLIGQRFGRLLVLEKGKTDNNGHIYWICQCDCGTIKEISGTNLLSNKIQSCGCLHKEIVSQMHLKDLTGQKFGKLTVLHQDKTSNLEQVKWMCQCDCGTICSVIGNNLKNGHTTSCGCIKSKGENIIRNFLNKNNIQYKTEYIFKDLPNRRFDFVIFDKLNKVSCIIEYDGKQHFQFENTWYKTQKEFNEAKQRDLEKNKFCKNNNIKLYRIPYYELDNIDKILFTILHQIFPDLEKAQEVTENDE